MQYDISFPNPSLANDQIANLFHGWECWVTPFFSSDHSVFSCPFEQFGFIRCASTEALSDHWLYPLPFTLYPSFCTSDHKLRENTVCHHTNKQTTCFMRLYWQKLVLYEWLLVLDNQKNKDQNVVLEIKLCVLMLRRLMKWLLGDMDCR